VVAIVDPRQFLSQRMKYNYFLESQIRHASILVLSKIGECGEQLVFQALEGVKALNSEAVLLAEPWEDFDFPWFRALLDDAVYLPPASPAGSGANAVLPHGDEIDIQSFGLTNVRDYTASQFHVMLDGIRRGLYGDVLRVKGYLRIDGIMREVNYSEGDDLAKNSFHPSSEVLSEGVHAEMATIPTGLTKSSAEDDSDIVREDLHVEQSKISVIGGRLHYGMLTKAFWRIPEPGTTLAK
jgi:G3E family GTPase